MCVALQNSFLHKRNEFLGVPFRSVQHFEGIPLQKERRSFNLRPPENESCRNMEDSCRNEQPSSTLFAFLCSSPRLSSWTWQAGLPGHCFLLEDLEGDEVPLVPTVVEDGAPEFGVASITGAASRLTILPMTNASLASYGWIGVGGRAPPVSAPSRLRGPWPAVPSSSFSIASGLTEPPSITAGPTSVAGGFMGGGVGCGLASFDGFQQPW